MFGNKELEPSGGVIFAPEGFVDGKYAPLLENDNVRIIELRVLADGPFFQTITHDRVHT